MSFLPENIVELKVQREIREAEDRLVQLIQKALSEKANKKLEESQFRNLVRVADTTESPEVIKNFLFYQVGRDEKWGRGKGSLAEQIISDIGTVEQGGELIDLARKIAKQAGSSNTKHIWIELIRRYLGYGARYLKYLRDGQTP